MSTLTPEIIEKHNLTQDEYALILKHLGREPNLTELGIFSVMWSEHCSYKSSRKHLKMFPTTGPDVIHGPGENAGVIDIGGEEALVFKMESHNHPSFIEPYQGAATGVGGILRDVFTMGARPIANLNALFFGAPDQRRTPFLLKGVVAGIAGYGNCMGIPTPAGSVHFDRNYNGNILVNAMTVGLVKKNKIFLAKAAGIGNPVFYIGARTGRDGIHGATMASDSFDDESESKKPTVQVGDPFTEKKLLEACLELMETDVIVGIQDMGAAGLTSSSFEMASKSGTGIEINLSAVPTREEGMTPYEIMLSESQERMLMVVRKGREEEARTVFQKWDLDVVEIGRVTDTTRYVATFQGREVVNLPVEPLADGAPVYDRPQKTPANLAARQKFDPDSVEQPENLDEIFCRLISHPNHASKQWVYEQYDHQVMTNTVILPGSDAAVLRLKGTKKGIAVTTDVNSRYCSLDPLNGGRLVVVEAARNLVCSGARPLALTDCLNFGNPEVPEIMWQFCEAVKGISEACRFFEIPVVSGNVSFYNETNGQSIYPTPTVGMVGLLDDIAQRKDIFFKNPGDVILLLGETGEEIGASAYLADIDGRVCGKPPAVDFEKESRLWRLIKKLNPLIKSCHDISDGGLLLALFEGTTGRHPVGVEIAIKTKMRPDFFLFSETQSRALISVAPRDVDQVINIINKNGVPCQKLGHGVEGRFAVSINGRKLIDRSLTSCLDLWRGGLESIF